MTTLKPIKLTGEQIDKLGKLANAIAPHFLVRVNLTRSNTTQEDEKGDWITKHFEHVYVYDTSVVEPYPWLEFCFIHLVPLIAEKYVKHHIDSTLSWATRMLSQHIAAQMNIHNPIDTLYDIWENPGKYAEDM